MLIPQSKVKPQLMGAVNSCTIAVLLSVVLSGCAAPAHQPIIISSDPVPPPPPTEVVIPMDDIPAAASPSVREHLMKLKELLGNGQITDADYRARRALILSR